MIGIKYAEDLCKEAPVDEIYCVFVDAAAQTQEAANSWPYIPQKFTEAPLLWKDFEGAAPAGRQIVIFEAPEGSLVFVLGGPDRDDLMEIITSTWQWKKSTLKGVQKLINKGLSPTYETAHGGGLAMFGYKDRDDIDMDDGRGVTSVQHEWQGTFVDKGSLDAVHRRLHDTEAVLAELVDGMEDLLERVGPVREVFAEFDRPGPARLASVAPTLRQDSMIKKMSCSRNYQSRCHVEKYGHPGPGIGGGFECIAHMCAAASGDSPADTQSVVSFYKARGSLVVVGHRVRQCRWRCIRWEAHRATTMSSAEASVTPVFTIATSVSPADWRI